MAALIESHRGGGGGEWQSMNPALKYILYVYLILVWGQLWLDQPIKLEEVDAS